MTDIKRYNIDSQAPLVWSEKPNGDWIKASDHDAVVTIVDVSSSIWLRFNYAIDTMQDKGQ